MLRSPRSAGYVALFKDLATLAPRVTDGTMGRRGWMSPVRKAIKRQPPRKATIYLGWPFAEGREPAMFAGTVPVQWSRAEIHQDDECRLNQRYERQCPGAVSRYRNARSCRGGAYIRQGAFHPTESPLEPALGDPTYCHIPVFGLCPSLVTPE